jgi:sortase A
VEVLEQTKDARVTLISCYPYLVDDQRIVVTARLESSR